jgi:hypothetical protein
VTPRLRRRTQTRLGRIALPFVMCGLAGRSFGAAPPSPPTGPVTNLEVTTAPPGLATRGASPPAGLHPRAGATLVLNSLSEAARLDLAHALERLATSLGRRRNPLFVPLDDGVERDEVERLLSDLGPAFAAAGALSVGRWTSSEGDLTVQGASRCRPGATCFPLGAAPGQSPLEGRARFLAWPVGFAVVVWTPDARRTSRIAASVRASRAKDSRIALVVTAAELHSLRGSPAVAEITRGATNVLRAGGDHNEALAPLLTSIADAASTSDEASWLNLPRGALLIVPRLGALATADAFVREARALLDHAGGKVDVEWLLSPRPR